MNLEALIDKKKLCHDKPTIEINSWKTFKPACQWLQIITILHIHIHGYVMFTWLYH